MDKVGVGIVGCGNISSAYLKAMTSAFPDPSISAWLADSITNSRKRGPAEFNLDARTVGELLDDPKVEIIVNLTIPKAHVSVGCGRWRPASIPIRKTARYQLQGRQAAGRRWWARGLRIGARPTPSLAAPIRLPVKALIDEGVIDPGRRHRNVHVPGPSERWHPNPAFYYEVGGGPMPDMGLH